MIQQEAFEVQPLGTAEVARALASSRVNVNPSVLVPEAPVAVRVNVDAVRLPHAKVKCVVFAMGGAVVPAVHAPT